MLTAYGRPQGVRGSGSCGHMWTGGVKNRIFCGRHKWMAPNATCRIINSQNQYNKTRKTVYIDEKALGLFSTSRSYMK